MNKKAISVVLSYALLAVDIVVGIFFIPFLLSSLGDSEYGLYKMLFSTASYLSVLDFGIGATITRYVVKYKTEKQKEKEQNFVAIGLIVYLFLASLVIVLSLIIAYFIPQIYANSISPDKIKYAQMMFIFICGATAVNLMNHAYTGLITAYEAFVFSKSSNIVKILLRVLLIVVGVKLKQSAFVIVLTDFLLANSLFIVNILFVKFKLHFKIKLHYWDTGLIKEAFVFTLAILGQSVINQFNTNANNVILGIFTTTSAVALYSIALQLYTMYASLSTAISTIYFPSISSAVFRGESDDEVTLRVIQPSRMQLCVLLLALTGFCIFGMDFINLWVGEKYSNVYFVAMILLVSSTLNLSQNTITSVLKAKNIFYGHTIILAISTVFNVAITCILVPKIGVFGSALGTAFSLIFGYGFALNIYYKKKAKINLKLYFTKTFSGILPAVLICVPLGILINYFIKCTSYLHFALEAGIYAIIYVIGIFFIGLNEKERNVVKSKISLSK